VGATIAAAASAYLLAEIIRSAAKPKSKKTRTLQEKLAAKKKGRELGKKKKSFDYRKVTIPVAIAALLGGGTYAWIQRPRA